MSTSVERAEGTPPDLDLIQAVSRFFQEDPARVLSVASSLRKPGRMIESTVLGMSMGRTIPSGSRIRIELGEQRRYERGEVIAFVAGPHVVVHRVLRQIRRGSRDFMLTRGDAALVPDTPVDADHVLGPVTAIHQGGCWTSLESGPRPSLPARLLMSVACSLIACALQSSPGSARALVRLLHRGRSLPPAALRPAAQSGGS